MATDRDQFRASVETQFIPFWTFTPIASENVQFNVEDQAEEWVRFSVRWLTGNFAAVGRTMIRREVLGAIQIFVPRGTGTARLDELAENALQFWEQTILGVRVRNPRAEDVGEDGKWFQVNVFADLEYDQFR